MTALLLGTGVLKAVATVLATASTLYAFAALDDVAQSQLPPGGPMRRFRRGAIIAGVLILAIIVAAIWTGWPA